MSLTDGYSDRYGHKKCGLIYRELCKDINEYISKEKKSILSGKNQSVKSHFDLQWSNMKKNFLDKLFKDKGFENPCSSSKFKYNKDLYPLRNKYVNFCKELEERKYEIQENNDFDKCVLYNKWIDTERAQFFHEYLPKVRQFNSKIVGEYLSPMQNDKTFNPGTIYLKNKINCSEIKRQQKELQRKRDVKSHTFQQKPRKPIARQESTTDGRNPATKAVVEKQKKTVQTSERESPKLTKENSKDRGLQKQAHQPTLKDPPQHTTPPRIQQPDPPVVVHPVRKSPSQVPTTSTTSAPTTSTTSAPTTSTTSSPTTSTTSAPTTSTTSAPTASTTLNQDSAKNGVMSTSESSSVSNSQDTNSASSLNQPKASPSLIDTQQTFTQLPASPNGNNGKGTFLAKLDSFPKAKSDTVTSSEPKNSIQAPDGLLSKGTQRTSGHTSSTLITRSDSNPPGTPNEISQNMNTALLHHPTTISAVPTTSKEIAASVNIATAKTGTLSKNNPTVRNNKNDNSNITPERLPPLINIIPTILIILTSITVLFLLYKYTLFGLFLGRRKKRKKRDLQRIFAISKEPTYESPNITLWEWEDPNLVGQTVKKDAYIKLLKINRYKQEMQKRKNKKKTTLIEVHMEIFEEYKNDEWELHKGDFLEICLRGFINEQNGAYTNFPNSELTISNKKKEKVIEDTEKQENLWYNWIESHRNIIEQWKKKEWFQILKNEWRKEQQIYKEKNEKLRENILSEQEKHSIVSQKDIWRQWISKQANFIDKINKEDWFKSMVDEKNKIKENYSANKYNENTIVTSVYGSDSEKSYHEPYRRKKIIEKLMVQMHIIVLEECIKEDIIKNKEICIDDYIQDINSENKYEEKYNMPKYAKNYFNLLDFQEINTCIDELGEEYSINR
ncbi:STP1 protein [Plasmodium ovale curtisi]|uniref:STP1 protein n=1 Tax=Plasmodium ovale curtisi TaxID=864141 RepID=A0A1A8WJS7_PLAOA|nr:STP1 protein [Plasmodium ovale curtisi]